MSKNRHMATAAFLPAGIILEGTLFCTICATAPLSLPIIGGVHLIIPPAWWGRNSTVASTVGNAVVNIEICFTFLLCGEIYNVGESCMPPTFGLLATLLYMWLNFARRLWSTDICALFVFSVRQGRHHSIRLRLALLC